MLFTDRADAGRRLAERLADLRGSDVVVIGLARGGVPVAFQVASAIDAPLDVMVCRKIGAPGNPEFALGAIAPDVLVLNAPTVEMLQVDRAYLERTAARESEEQARRDAAYRPGHPPVNVEGRTVIVIDDGLATGATAAAALESVRRRRPARLVFATPVAAPGAAQALQGRADEVVVLAAPPGFHAVGQFYHDFSATSDAEVLACLAASRTRREASSAG